MHPFTLVRHQEMGVVIAQGREPGTEYIAGGTDLLQLLKDDLRKPSRLVDLDGLGLDRIEVSPEGLTLGALARMSDVADHPEVRRQYPVIAQALAESASPQVRNLATIGGNLLQRTRCVYFRDAGMPCNKREPGSGCPAIPGRHRMLAIFGGSDKCIATHPSDLAVALAALDATVRLHGADGAREVKLTDFHLLPGDHPETETVLAPGELITEIFVPAGAWTRRSHYLKVRDRATFDFALTAAAVALEIERGKVKTARLAVGGVGTKPWRLPGVERALAGVPANAESWRHAGELAAQGAMPLRDNCFKVALLKNSVTRAFEQAGGEA